MRDFGDDFAQDFGLEFMRYFVRYFGLDVGLGLNLVWYFIRDFMRDFGRYVGRDCGWRFGRDFVPGFVRGFVLEYVTDFGRQIAAAWAVGPDVAVLALWEDFAVIEAFSAAGRAGVRAAVAHAEDYASDLGLFRLACRVSLGHEPVSLQLNDALARYQGDPLWPALALHIARISTSEDRALLEDLAARPEQREGPVSWALRYYVRGDIVMHDGAVITMDEICDELGMPRLALLEDMAPEIEIDFDFDEDDGVTRSAPG